MAKKISQKEIDIHLRALGDQLVLLEGAVDWPSATTFPQTPSLRVVRKGVELGLPIIKVAIPRQDSTRKDGQ